jgi:hypothetical protein
MKKPYDDRSDLQKLHSQWTKIQGIFDRRKEWSAAIVRAATATEIAMNIAIRERFKTDSQFSKEFVNHLLVWANGMDGKLKKLIIPSERDGRRRRTLNGLKKSVERLNAKRNAIVHRGVFANADEAVEYVRLARKISTSLGRPWDPAFKLKVIRRTASKGKREPSRE